MCYTIKPVRSKQDLTLFVHFIYTFYKNDPNWVAPLRMEERKKFDAKSNPMLLHCEIEFFLLLKNNKPVGRIAAFIDKLALEHWGEPVGLFGLFECIDNIGASQLLLDAASNWLRERGIKKMRGPWGITPLEWGLVIKGFNTPMMMSPYNFPYYDTLIETFGLRKVKDVMVYEVNYSKEYEFPEKILKSADQISKKNGVHIRSLNMRNLEADVKIILRLANETAHHLWGFVPITNEEVRDFTHSLKKLVDADVVLIAETADKPIGYMIALPDINLLIKGQNGRLFPVSIFKLLFCLKKIRNYRVWAFGIIPEYCRKAIDTLFYKHLYEVLPKKNLNKIEANFILEDNMNMNNPLLKMGFQHSKTYRVYEMEID